MIRVLHSVSNMDRGGIETMIMNLYRNIDREKVQFDFLCNKAKPGQYDDEIHSMGGKIFISPGLNPAKFFKYQQYMKRLINENGYKIVHAHNGAFGYYPLLAAKKNDVPVRIFHAHGASITFDLKWPLKMLCKSGLSAVYNQQFTCGKKAAECYFGKKAVEQNDYVMINNAINIDNFAFSQDTRTKIREENNLQERLVIGHVGRFMQQKNHSFLIDIFKEVHKLEPKALLMLFGDGELMDTIKQKVSEHNLQNDVIFMGNIPNVNEWYQAMDAFVLPSFWEGLPVVGIESQASSLPCFFSDTITGEVKITDSAYFIPLSNETVWAKKILEITKTHTRNDVRDAVKFAGYSIPEQAKALEDLYLQLSANH